MVRDAAQEEVAMAKFSIKVDTAQVLAMEIALRSGFNPKVINKALNDASKAAANEVVKAARPKAPVVSGRMKAAIGVKPARYAKPGYIARINPGSSRADVKGAYYRYMALRGTGRNPRNNRFMDEAAQSTIAQAEEAYTDRLRRTVNKAAGKPLIRRRRG
jgi:hypothetical protein